MNIILELLRAFFIVILLGGIGATILNSIYLKIGVADSYSWSGTLAILLLIFLLYRNNLQFSGWYKGKGRNRLSSWLTFWIIIASIILIILPFVLNLI